MATPLSSLLSFLFHIPLHASSVHTPSIRTLLILALPTVLHSIALQYRSLSRRRSKIFVGGLSWDTTDGITSIALTNPYFTDPSPSLLFL